MKKPRISKIAVKTRVRQKKARASQHKEQAFHQLPLHWPQFTTPDCYSYTMAGMPKGAIVADWSKHAPHNSDSPIFWYADKPCTCRDCGLAFVFSMYEQRLWYEDYKIPIYVQAVRCLACRRKLRGIATRVANASTDAPSNASRPSTVQSQSPL